MRRNNLFEFATSELSQDAFLCWSINWLNESRHPLYTYGKAMLDLLLGDKKQNNYGEKVEIRSQYEKIDVLVLFKDDNDNPHALIIEDKVHTSVHGDQMSRYKKALSGKIKDSKLEEYREMEDCNIHMAYVKTGIIYDYEEFYADSLGATLVTLDDLLDVIENFFKPDVSDILLDFRDYHQERRVFWNNIKRQIGEGRYEEALKYHYGQFYFLKEIFSDRKREKVGNTHVDKKDKENEYVYVNTIYSSSNISGTPWTQYCFLSQKYKKSYIDVTKNEYHALFWRIDCDSKGDYYISLRHYDANRKSNNQDSIDRKRNVYREFRAYADAEYNKDDKYKHIVKSLGVRENYKESDLIYIPVKNLKGMGFDEIKEMITNITNSFAEKFKNTTY